MALNYPIWFTANLVKPHQELEITNSTTDTCDDGDKEKELSPGTKDLVGSKGHRVVRLSMVTNCLRHAPTMFPQVGMKFLVRNAFRESEILSHSTWRKGSQRQGNVPHDELYQPSTSACLHQESFL